MQHECIKHGDRNSRYINGLGISCLTLEAADANDARARARSSLSSMNYETAILVRGLIADLHLRTPQARSVYEMPILTGLQLTTYMGAWSLKIETGLPIVTNIKVQKDTDFTDYLS